MRFLKLLLLLCGAGGIVGAAEVAINPHLFVMGVPGYDFVAEIGLLAPAGTPADIIARLSKEISNAIRQADVAQRFAQLGIDAAGSTPEAYAAVNRASYEKYARVVKLSGAKID